MADLPSITLCVACHAPIVFALLPSGKRMPLDAKPAADGRFQLLDGWATTAPVDYSGPRFKAHWATCSSPDRFRKPKGK